MASDVGAIASALAASANRYGLSAASLPDFALPSIPAAAAGPASSPLSQPSAAASADPRAQDLINLALKTLQRAIDDFAPVKAKINMRIKNGQRLNRGSATLTAILSSSALGALQFGGKDLWTAVLGLLTLLAALLTLFASWSGDAKFVDEFGEVSAKAEKAGSLLDRLDIYSKNPDRFPDWPEWIKQASELADYIKDKIGRWNVGA